MCQCVQRCIWQYWPSLWGPTELSEQAPAAARGTEAKTSSGRGVRGLWKFLEASENCCATPGSLLVHSWGPGVKENGIGGREGGLQGHSHMLDLPGWPYYTLHILPSPWSIYSFCVWALMFWKFFFSFSFFNYLWVKKEFVRKCQCVCWCHKRGRVREFVSHSYLLYGLSRSSFCSLLYLTASFRCSNLSLNHFFTFMYTFSFRSWSSATLSR